MQYSVTAFSVRCTPIPTHAYYTVNHLVYVVVTGGAGTGKSYVATAITSALRAVHGDDAVAVTAPTGVAAMNIQGVTLVRFIGGRKRASASLDLRIILKEEDGSDSDSDNEDDEVEMLEEHYLPVFSTAVEERMKKLKVLIIDEISMCSDHMFQLLNYVLHFYRRKMPHIQVVLIGDFAQLPPVVPQKSMLAQAIREGKFRHYLFESVVWNRLGLVQIELTVCKRTKHKEYIRILGMIREGVSLDHNTMTKLKSLTRQSRDGIQIAIFSRRHSVNAWNEEQTMAMDDNIRLYHAKDKPSQCGFVPKRLLAQSLRLKPQMPIMSLINKDSYANGTIMILDEFFVDRVHAIQTNKDGEQRQVNIGTFTDKSLAPRKSGGPKRYGSRTQLPIRPSFGFTVHKSQGKTICDPFLVECDFYDSGQAYVALSRAADPSLMYLDKLTTHCQILLDDAVRNFHQRLRSCKLAWFVPSELRSEDERLAEELDLRMAKKRAFGF